LSNFFASLQRNAGGTPTFAVNDVEKLPVGAMPEGWAKAA